LISRGSTETAATPAKPPSRAGRRRLTLKKKIDETRGTRTSPI
jgi:hypothetical protein